MADTPTAALSSDHTPALSTSATPTSTTGPDAAERLAGLVILLGDIAASIAAVRNLVRDLEEKNPGHGVVICEALAVSCFLADFGAKYGAGAPSCDDALEWMLSDRAMRAGVTL